MIKLIIFDLDGVLIESKDIHFLALNKALADYKQTEITHTEHVSIYDGLPTKEKLKLKKVDESLHTSINQRKQEYTFALLKTHVKNDNKLINIFKSLKKDGFKVCVASNSIRYTIQLVLYELGILEYCDYVVSNQDVRFSKPHAEMYLRCMIECGVSPKETLIIEDSYVGRAGAYNSGAYLCAVKNTSEVTLENIYNNIRQSNGEKQKWKDTRMNILVPMAGAGSRFQKAGYTFPKPLIEVRGKPMIQVVVDNINIDANYIFIVQKEHYEKYNLNYMLECISPKCKVIQVDKLTEGAACTTLLAKEYINNNQPLLIANSDQWIKWDSSDFMYQMQSKNLDGGILTFENTHPKWSYVRLDENGYVTEVREKEVISNKATVGIYYWSRGDMYVKYAEQMISKNIRVNNEFYVAPVYNEAIKDGFKVKPYDVQQMLGLGTPEDLNEFLRIHNGSI